MPGMKITLNAAMRARDVSRPRPEQEAAAEQAANDLPSARPRPPRPEPSRSAPSPAAPVRTRPPAASPSSPPPGPAQPAVSRAAAPGPRPATAEQAKRTAEQSTNAAEQSRSTAEQRKARRSSQLARWSRRRRLGSRRRSGRTGTRGGARAEGGASGTGPGSAPAASCTWPGTASCWPGRVGVRRSARTRRSSAAAGRAAAPRRTPFPRTPARSRRRPRTGYMRAPRLSTLASLCSRASRAVSSRPGDRGPDPADLVGRDLLPVARPADHDAQAVGVRGDRAGRAHHVDGVVVLRLVAGRTAVDSLVAGFAQPLDQGRSSARIRRGQIPGRRARRSVCQKAVHQYTAARRRIRSP